MGKKKKAAESAPLSKKERKALEKKVAALQAELAARAEKKAKKGKKSKAEKSSKKAGKESASPVVETPAAEPEALTVTPAAAEAKAARKAKREAEKAASATSTARDETIDPETGKTRPEVIEARKAERDETQAELDAAIKARVQAKRAAREAGEPVDVKAARMPDALDGESEVEYQQRRLREKSEAAAISKTAEAVAAIGQAIEVVETEHGREFAAGASVAADDFAKPSEAPRTDFETNGNGQYKVKRPSDGKMVGYTRVTTYIACLEDTTALEKWKARILLEGVAAGDSAEVVATVNNLAHNRDEAIEKARRRDRKGQLQPGELATYVAGAWADFKRGMGRLADEVFEVGGGREAATKGTDIHALCATAAVEGIQPIADMLTAGEVTPSDLADVEAFLDALDRLGARVIEVERVVVNDDLKVAGRLDYVVMVRLPGETRGRRRVLDLKTGRVDYGTAKIAQQLEMYAGANGYDLETHEREDLKLDRAKGILVHLPAGSGKASAYVANLTLGRRGNRLAGEVRTWRNEGKRAIDLKADLLAPAGGAS